MVEASTLLVLALAPTVVPCTLINTVQLLLAGTVIPVNCTDTCPTVAEPKLPLVLAREASVAPAQVPPTLVAPNTEPEGKSSVKEPPVRSMLLGLVKVNVSVVNPLIDTALGASKALAMVGGEDTTTIAPEAWLEPEPAVPV